MASRDRTAEEERIVAEEAAELQREEERARENEDVEEDEEEPHPNESEAERGARLRAEAEHEAQEEQDAREEELRDENAKLRDELEGMKQQLDRISKQVSERPLGSPPSARSAGRLPSASPVPAVTRMPATNRSIAQPLRFDFKNMLAPPPTLQVKGLTPDVAESWLFAVEKMFAQFAIEDTPTRMGLIAQLLDLDATRWWTQQRIEKEKEGRTITWEVFTECLKTNYIPVSHQQRAAIQMLELKQHSNEDMEAYMLRADQLLAASGKTAADADNLLFAELVLKNMDHGRYPMAYATTRGKLLAGEIKSFAALRQTLNLLAYAEPIFNRGAQQQQQKGGGRGGGRMDVNGVTQQDRPPMKCYKCGKIGHAVRQCTSSAELRECYNCKTKGHLASACTKPKTAAGGGGSAPGGSPTASDSKK